MKSAKDFLVVMAVLVVLSLGYAAYELLLPVAIENGHVEVELKKGISFKGAAAVLSGKKVIRDADFFIFAGKLMGVETSLKPGVYSFDGSVRPWEVLTMLGEGRVAQFHITIFEGETMYDVREKLASAGLVDPSDFDAVANDPDFLGELRIEAPSVEGYLYPDTYKLPKGTSARDAIEMMVRRLRRELTPDLMEHARETGMSERSVLTLASIIEKEAVLDGERPLISAVYHNRLDKGIPLQADPTTIYGIKNQREGITGEDIRRKTDYNTYFIEGLPPGPIASPGIKSIKAALYPADAPYLFFVANGDGSHMFSTTLREHQRSVEELKKRRRLERSRNGGA